MKDKNLMTSLVNNAIDGSLLSQLADVDSEFYKRDLLKISENEKKKLARICLNLILFGDIKR